MNLSETIRSVFPWVDERDLAAVVSTLEKAPYTTVLLPFPSAVHQQLEAALPLRTGPLKLPEMYLQANKKDDVWLWHVTSSFDIATDRFYEYLPLDQAKTAWQLLQQELTSQREQTILQDILNSRTALSLLSNYKGVA